MDKLTFYRHSDPASFVKGLGRDDDFVKYLFTVVCCLFTNFMSDDVQKIKDRLDILELVGEYVQLKRSGVNWKGCCPFHQEKTPSFMVNPEKQIFHCFGCAKGGDIFTFIQEIEGMDFAEALKFLAEKAGVQLSGNFKKDIDQSQKNRILEINKKAANFFHRLLLEMPAGQKALDYLKNRGLDLETIKEWQIGYAPKQWDLLIRYLRNKGCALDDIVAAGLAIKKENADPKSGRGYYDRFRGRVMFPINDLYGHTVGFTGRVLVVEENSGGKYVNTPQTLAYDKSRVLYGLDKAKTFIKNQKNTVLVEGQMDVIACHQADMKNVVAVSGTALTETQAKMLKRYSDNISMAFDSDRAGVEAAKRGIDVALTQGINVKVIEIPPSLGKDADECIKNNRQKWFETVKNAKDVMEWYFDLYLKDANGIKSKREAAEALLIEISKILSAVEREQWVKELSERLSIGLDVLKQEAARLVVAGRPRTFSSVSSQAPGNSFLKADDPKKKMLDNLLMLFLRYPAAGKKHISRCKSDFFSEPNSRELYESVLKAYNKMEALQGGTDLSIDKLLDGEKQSLSSVLLLQAEVKFAGLNDEQADKEADKILSRLEREWTNEEMLRLTKEADIARKEGDLNKLEELNKKIKKVYPVK